MSSLLYLTLLFLSTAWCQTRTIWQYQLGPIVVNPYFGSAPSQDRTAQQNAFTLSDPIPAADTNWIDCYPGDQWCASASQINTVAHGSRLPGGDCWEHLAFEYFQTYIDVPAGVTVTQFTIQYPGNVVDDAARITMYNSLYPAGQTLSFTFYQQADTVDLSPFLTTGSNRLIITQEDSCCCGNTVFAIIQLNGVTLLPTCTPPAQDPCTFSTWSSVANDCVLSPISGPSCDDGNPCTQNDVCVSGSCVGQPVVCTAPQCNSASCDSATGACVVSPSGTGNGCNDGDACTLSDTCNNGVCAGTPVVCTALDQCHVAGTCSGGVCSNPAATDGTGCEDGNPCTLNDVCTAGACTSGAEKVCTASDQCHVPGVCDTTTGDCSNPNKCDGKLCDDGNACTQLDTCKNGVCVGIRPVICTVESDCQEAGTCNPATGKCSLDNQCDGTSCNDGNACTLTDTCLDGDCIGSNPVVCQPLDQCHVAGVCDPATGACSNPNVADGTACNDGNACTQTDTCQAGVCVGSNPVVCTASDQCHVAGVCDPTSGVCSNPSKANGATCNDGNACTQTDTCQAGTCTGSNPVVCTPSDQCHSAGTCNPASGKCSNPNRPDGTTCDDHDACTQFDVCTNGACSGTQVCCRTHNGRCGTCVTNCQGSHQSVLNLFKLNGGQNDVENGGNCSGGKVCCVPKDQSTCNNGNNSCKIPDGDGDGEDGGDGNEGDGHGGDRD